MVKVDDESFIRKDIELVNVCCDHNRDIFIVFLGGVEETVAYGSVLVEHSVKVKVVLGRLIPAELVVRSRVYHRELLF